MSTSKTTRDHEEIRRWAEERGGKPSCVKNTGGKNDIGILRIDFPGYSGEGSLEEISWEEFFEKFDDQDLSLLYQEETAEGQKSNFNKLVSSETAAEAEHRVHAGAHEHAGASKRSSRRTGGSSAKKSAPKKATGKKTAVKKTAKKVAGKKVAAKKTAAKKASAKKATSKKATGKKTPSKKAATKKSAAKKTAAKKTIAKKSSAKRATKKASGRRR